MHTLAVFVGSTALVFAHLAAITVHIMAVCVCA